MKFEPAQTNFITDVFEAVAVVIALKAPNRCWSETAANPDFVLFANLVVSSNYTRKLTSRLLKLF